MKRPYQPQQLLLLVVVHVHLYHGDLLPPVAANSGTPVAADSGTGVTSSGLLASCGRLPVRAWRRRCRARRALGCWGPSSFAPHTRPPPCQVGKGTAAAPGKTSYTLLVECFLVSSASFAAKLVAE